MDNGWQMKCGTPLPLSSSMIASSVAAATQIPAQEPGNQMKLNLGHYVLPHSVQEPTLMSPGVKSAPTFSYMLNFGSCKSVTAENGHSSLSAVSVLPSMFQHDFLEQSTGKSPSSGYYSTKSSFCDTGTMPNWPLLKNGGNLNPSRPTPPLDVQPTFPFRPTHITSKYNIHGQHNDLDALRTVIRTENGSILQKGLSCPLSRAADGEVCHVSIGNSVLEASLRATSSIAMNQTPVGSECPRVFCMSACGDLLLSNTGLLGILCSCHGLHMSVSNFCEHSGLSDVNPGYAVRMDNGECIAQWRKLYLQKFGITAPDDCSGWDWPEGLLATSSLVRSKVAVPHGRKVLDLSSLFTSSVESIKSSHPRNNVFPGGPQLSQEFVNKMSTAEQLGNGYQQYSLMGHTVSSRRDSYSMTDNPSITCGASSCLMVSRASIGGGSTNDCQSSSLHSGFSPSSENLFSLAHPNMQGIGSKTHNNNLKDEIVLQRSALPSSIDLKLGQPSQWGQGVGSTTLSTIKSNIRDVQTTTCQEQLSNNSRNSRVVEHCDQRRLHFHPISNLRRTKEQFQLDNLNNERCTENGASGLKHWKDGLYDSSGSSGFSLPISSSNTPAGGSGVHQKENNKGTDESHHFVPWRLHSESHVDKSGVMELSCDGGDGPIWSLAIKGLGLQKKEDSSTNTRFGHYSNFRSDSSCGLYAQQMENSGFFTEGGKPSHHSNCTVPDEKYNSLGMAGRLPDLYCASIDIENACSLGNIPDPDVSSSLVFGAAKMLQERSSGSTSLTVVRGPGHDSASLNNDVHSVNSHRPGESLRFLALRTADKSGKHKLPDVSMGLNQSIRNCPQQRGWTKNYSISNVGVRGSFLDAGPSKGRHDRPFTFGDDATPNAVLDIGGKQACDVGNGTAAEDNDNRNGLRVVMHGMAFNSEVTDKHVQSPCAPQPKEQPSLSLGRGGNKVNGCDMFQRCCAGPYTCSSGGCCCGVPSMHSNKEWYSKDASTRNSSNKQVRNAVIGAPKLAGFRLSDNSGTIEKAILDECSPKMKEQKHRKLGCLDSQWRDLPAKMIPVSKIRCPNASEQSLVKNGEAVSHLREIGAEGICSDQVAKLQGIESSNISSGSSAPAVAQTSIEVDKIDSSNVDAVDTGKGDDQIADQGSVINISCSCDAIGSVKSSQHACCGKARSTEEESPSELLNVAPHGVDEFKQRHFESKELRILGHSGASYGEGSCTMQENENKSISRKRKHIINSTMMGRSLAVSHVSLLPSESPVYTRNAPDNHAYASEDGQVLLQSNQDSSNGFDSNTKDRGYKRRRSSLSSVKMLPHKRDLNRIYNFFESKSDDQRPLRYNSDSVAIPEDVSVKRLRHVKPAESVMKPVNAIEGAKQVCLYNPDSDGTLKCSVHCLQKPVSVNDENLCKQKAKPIACGKYGIICSRELDLDQLKPPKILSLNQVLRSSRRISTFENENAVASVQKMVHFSDGREIMCGSITSCNGQVSKVPSQKGGFHGTSAHNSFRTYDEEDEIFSDGWSACGKVGASGSKRNTSSSSCCPPAQSKPKEIRVRSLYELSMRGKEVISAELSLCRTVMCEVSMECEPKRDASKGTGESDGSVARRSLEKSNRTSLISELDAPCCVCGMPNNDSTDCLLECGGCFIRIHQACYGISRVSKGHWYCRPCKTGAKNAACVLCGYGDGAMTRAFGSHSVVKTLLRAWNIRTESQVMALGSAEKLYVPAKFDSETAKFRSSSSIRPMVHNSVIAGLFDRTVRQWVHMVCGLWTPGARCPNVDTMSAFDVSGVPRPKAHMVCHICKRPGGSYTRCHVETCSSYFHPWCAHQKGLLHSEVGCFDNRKVRFYGRCLLHADHQPIAVESDNANDDSETAPKKEPTCARTQVCRRTKLESRKHRPCQHNGKGKCLVTQVQLDAWLYINRQKFGSKRRPKLPVSAAEHDYRKEYARYKQGKRWKQLVVYKSGIHALGLYTSLFIPRGGMVVEYVGEIVGPRVADKRESEYLSGRKLQYKGACYFFRIDKEQIIDATRKGGIARFVNHSCQPNCVAKVITVRSEKKVVFFAQRDIYPGEEITYDYHFNHEDEGKKIPCFCKSNNCRRYLN